MDFLANIFQVICALISSVVFMVMFTAALYITKTRGKQTIFTNIMSSAPLRAGISIIRWFGRAVVLLVAAVVLFFVLLSVL